MKSSTLPTATGRRLLRHIRAVDLPFRNHAKKRHVYIWQCCRCGYSSIPISSGGCPGCGDGRCAYCTTTRVQVRPHTPLLNFPFRHHRKRYPYGALGNCPAEETGHDSLECQVV
ncbi:hypothetical protein BKA58DRAFT_215447 [Alternaria rosae]|uniref:uncharacterized protein n=1 Tax=Alternaria rosae TaxID=1187941 RepID=UPI001E8EB332|nr:uncharacterized protein BKA58DRAFT_215447 [Alternaria rosae]KAH6866988.1 hypothetical protein BKA58DRAFT_215447 [Alternaria rosae]